jgi:hypothetical protein
MIGPVMTGPVGCGPLVVTWKPPPAPPAPPEPEGFDASTTTLPPHAPMNPAAATPATMTSDIRE